MSEMNREAVISAIKLKYEAAISEFCGSAESETKAYRELDEVLTWVMSEDAHLRTLLHRR